MEWFVALRYLTGKRKLGFISLITYFSIGGVFLGSFVLVVALAIANGFEKEVRDRIVGTLAHAKILKYHSKPISPDEYDSVNTKILAHPQVAAASPYIMGKGGIEHEGVQEGVMIFGIDYTLEKEVTDIETSIKDGVFNLDSAESHRKRVLPGILIGLGMADKLGVRSGNEVVLMSLAPVEGELDPVPKMTRFVVRGVFETGMYEYDLNLVYISIPAAQNLFLCDGIEGIQIKTTDLFKAGEIARSVKDMLGGYPYKSVDWLSQNRSLFEWMKLEKLIIFVVISLIIVVAAFNIVSSLIMMILEKRREIGLLMSMGSSSKSVMKIFVFNGIIIGLVGSTAGTILGVLLCMIQHHYGIIPLPGDIYFINTLPVLLNWTDVIVIYIASNIICILAASYPAYQASKLLPASAMRFE